MKQRHVVLGFKNIKMRLIYVQLRLNYVKLSLKYDELRPKYVKSRPKYVILWLIELLLRLPLSCN